MHGIKQVLHLSAFCHFFMLCFFEREVSAKLFWHLFSLRNFVKLLKQSKRWLKKCKIYLLVFLHEQLSLNTDVDTKVD